MMVEVFNGDSNRLAKEKSPYLLQHAHNPVLVPLVGGGF